MENNQETKANLTNNGETVPAVPQEDKKVAESEAPQEGMSLVKGIQENLEQNKEEKKEEKPNNEAVAEIPKESEKKAEVEAPKEELSLIKEIQENIQQNNEEKKEESGQKETVAKVEASKEDLSLVKEIQENIEQKQEEKKEDNAKVADVPKENEKVEAPKSETPIVKEPEEKKENNVKVADVPKENEKVEVPKSETPIVKEPEEKKEKKENDGETISGLIKEALVEEKPAQDVVAPPSIPGNENVGNEKIKISEEVTQEGNNEQKAKSEENKVPEQQNVPVEEPKEPEPKVSTTEMINNAFFPTQQQGEEEVIETATIQAPRSPRNIQTAASPRRRIIRRDPPPQEVDPMIVEPISKKFIKDEKVKETDPVILAAVVVDLELKRNELMATEGKSKEGVKVAEAIERAKAEQHKAAMNKASLDRTTEIDGKIKETKEKIDELTRRNKEEEKEQEQELKRKVDDFVSRQKLELDYFEDEWQSEEKCRRYNRASQKLKMMKVQHNLLLNAKRFKEAEMLAKDISQREQFEVAESSRAMQLEYTAARKQLVEKQKEKLCDYTAALEFEKEKKSLSNTKKVEKYEKRKKMLEEEKVVAQDPVKVWQTWHRNDPDPSSLVAKPKDKSLRAFKNSTSPAEFSKIRLPPLRPQTSRQKKN